MSCKFPFTILLPELGLRNIGCLTLKPVGRNNCLQKQLLVALLLD